MNTKQNKTGRAMPIPDKIEFKSRRLIGNKKIHFMVIKGPTHNDNIAVYKPYSKYQSFKV